ncbi:hypothetical protein ACJW30_11G093700 [Castanea mollissima]
MREQPRPQQQILRQRDIYLPDDLVINNILTRLPVKSVMRFRCVCKSWYSSIKPSDFIDTHLSNYKDSHDINGYVIHMPSVRNTFFSSSSSSNTSIPVCTVAFDRTFDKISDVRIPLDVNFNQIVGSCNGLLCVANSDNVVYLWNPSIRKFKRLPDTLLVRLVNVTLGFAYHPENNDYKVVRISSTPFGAPVSYHEIEVYTLSSDSWRRVETPSTTNVILYDKNFSLPIPLVNGALHWMLCITEGEKSCKSRTIMAFDVNSEKFRKLALPHGSIDENTFQTFLASFKGKLAFITWERSEQPRTQYSIWVMKEYGVFESWNKLCVVPFERVSHCSAFTENGSLLVCYINDQEEKPDFKFVLVDTETLHEKKDPDIQQHSYVANFMESLVLLDGTNMVAY